MMRVLFGWTVFVLNGCFYISKDELEDRLGEVESAADVDGENTAPEVSSIGLVPIPLYTNDRFTAQANFFDPDGDAVTFTYDWHVNSISVVTGTDNTLDGALHV